MSNQVYQHALEQFRSSVYSLFPKRQDALMNLIDAISSYGHCCRSVTELSTAPCFERRYSSITDAIDIGATKMPWPGISKLMHHFVHHDAPHTIRKFIIDCTPNPRPFAHTLADRAIIHAPNPAPGNKPICVGHQYSALVQLPCDTLSTQKHWVAPMDIARVTSIQKGNEVGMQQLIDHLERNQLTDQLTMSIGDSLYGTEACRITASRQDNLVHLFRLNSQRNVFLPPEEASSSVGRKKVFGQKIRLSDPSTFPPCDETEQTIWVSAKGKTYSVNIECWKTILLRGSRQFRSEKHPITLIKVTVTDEQGNDLFKHPLMLGVFGKRRHEVGLIEAYESYRSRYDIEHFFRFGKQKLLMDAYQTFSVEHEEAWWRLCLISYHQLYLARLLTQATPRPWEKYLPAYQEKAQKNCVTPTQAQRGLANLLEQIGTPALPCVTRGTLSGRVLGTIQEKRPKQAIHFKGKAKAAITSNEDLNNVISTLEKTIKNTSPKKIEKLVRLVQDLLNKNNFSAEEFTKLLINSS